MEGLPVGAATMTVLFTDLVGSTAMRTRLGDDRADAVRREHDELLGRVIDEHRGVVVKGLGDGLMATFRAPSEALAAAVTINHAVARRNRKGGEPLVLRMGISVGEVRVEGDDVFGTPVVEAARLCGKAADEQILAAVWVRALAGSRAGVSFEPVGELVLKGLADPLEAYEVDWRAADRPLGLPFPDLDRLERGVPLVGRDAEVAVLRAAWEQAQAGTGPFVLLEGPAGVGTTRLAAEVALLAHDGGATVLYGHADADGGPPFRPFAEALRHQLAHLPDGALRSHLGPDAADLVRLVPELAGRLPGAEAQGDPSRSTDLPAAVTGWLSATSAVDPVLLLIDDLHLASRSTLDLLGGVLTATEPSRLLVVATAATGPGVDRQALDELLAELADGGAGAPRSVVRAPVADLGPDGTAAVVSSLLGEGLDATAADVAERIHRATGGRPLAVRRVARRLVRTEQVRRDGGHWICVTPVDQLDLDAAVPVDGLRPPERQVLALAALAGDDLDPDLLAAADALAGDVLAGGTADVDGVARGEAPLADVVDGAVAAGLALGLLAEHPDARRPYAFAHPSVRDELHRALSSAHRAALAVALATALERRIGPDRDRYLSELASLWSLAAADQGPGSSTPGPPDQDAGRAGAGGGAPAAARAAEHAAAAGDRARRHLAHDEAVAWYGLALRWHRAAGDADEHRTVDLLLARAEEAVRAGAPEAESARREAATGAAALGDGVAMARAALAGRRRPDHPLPLADPDQVALLAAARRALPADRTDQRGLVVASLALELVAIGDPARADLAAEAVALGAEAPADLRAELAAHQVAALAGVHFATARREAADGLAAAASIAVDPAVRQAAAGVRADVALEDGDVAGAGAALADLREESARLRRSSGSWLAAVREGAFALLVGDVDQADAFASAAADLGRRADGADALEAARLTRPLLVAVRGWQGRLDVVADELEALVGASPSADGFGAAVALAAAGRREPAKRAYDRAAAAGFVVADGPAALASLAHLASLAATFRDQRGAVVLATRLEAHARRHPVLVVAGPCIAHQLGRLAGLLGDSAGTDHWFGTALDLHQQRGSTLYAAVTRVAWAEQLVSRGDVDAARRLAGPAALTGRAQGAPALEATALAVLAEAVPA
ncbi:MAG: AAA family ATPase [Acidimicrobiales bacterium]